MRRFLIATAILCVAGNSLAVNTFSDGSDGALVVGVGQNVVIDLSQAPTGTWSDAASGDGIYDPTEWAVVFKYSVVVIAEGATVSFTNHPSRAPVVWLVQDSVSVDTTATIDLTGADGTGGFSEPGPGGFRGAEDGPGLGPGGAHNTSIYGGGSYGTGGVFGGSIYGNERVLPLIGGSGGSSQTSGGFAGAGGGAILIAAGTTITLSGTIDASGGDFGAFSAGGGAGGGIRLIAETVEGNGTLLCDRGLGSGGRNGGFGRIRIETNNRDFTGTSTPAFTEQVPLVSTDAEVWPPSDAPTVTVLSVDGESVPAEPTAEYSGTGDVFTTASAPVTVLIQAMNVPITGWDVVLNVSVDGTVRDTYFASLVGGNLTLSTWEVTNVTLPGLGFVAMQVRATD